MAKNDRWLTTRRQSSTTCTAILLAAATALVCLCILKPALQAKHGDATTGGTQLPSDSALLQRVRVLEQQLLAARTELHKHSVTASSMQQHAAPDTTTSQPLPELAQQDASDGSIQQQMKQLSDGQGGLDNMPEGSTVWVTFVNGDEKYRELMLNWAYHLRLLGAPHLVVAFDDVAAGVCEDSGIPHLRDFSKFRQMGSNKPLIATQLLQRPNVSTVILSDVDTVWLRDPSEFFFQHPTADVMISTDCLSAWLEAQHDPSALTHKQFHRCGHLPGTTFGRAFNTGVIVFRDRPATLAVLREWREMLTDPDSKYAPRTNGGHFQVTDQLAFNIVLLRNISSIESASEETWRVVRAMGGELRLLPLPVLLFTTGHTFFYQHLPQHYGINAYVVHCTFQRHHTAGKRARLREEGLWLADPPGYFAVDALMTYRNDVSKYIAALEAAASETLPPLFKHFHAMSYQAAALHDAFGMAQALNRTLDWYASVLPQCRVDGSDLALPFTCPLDILLNPQNLDESPLDYRLGPFLSDSRLPQRVRHSREAVVMDSNADWIDLQRTHSAGAGGFMAAGASADVLAHELESMAKVHILEFQGLRPDAFGGFGDATANTQFDGVMKNIFGDDATWCCSGEQPIDVKFIAWQYIMPGPLTTDVPASWPVPQYTEPPHCATIRAGEAGQLNQDFLKHANHPCTFLARRIQLPAALEAVLPSRRQLALPQPST